MTEQLVLMAEFKIFVEKFSDATNSYQNELKVLADKVNHKELLRKVKGE